MAEKQKNLYVAQQKGSCYYKIGVSHNPIARLQQLSTSNPHPLKLVLCFPFSRRVHPYAVEKTLHNKFASSHVRREWFSLSATDLVKIELFCLKKQVEALIKNNDEYAKTLDMVRNQTQELSAHLEIIKRGLAICRSHVLLQDETRNILKTLTKNR